MFVKSILTEKGHEVLTISQTSSVGMAVNLLAKHRIGALVVTNEAHVIGGIISERDIIRRIAEDGIAILEKPVADVMTANVKVCTENHTVEEVMEIMTRGRFRHMPVERDGVLIGVVSIGDVVKRKIEKTEQEAEAIKSYITSG